MEEQKWILVDVLCTHYELELTFFDALENVGLIEMHIVNSEKCLAQDQLADLERMIRLHNDLHVNLEGIDVVFNLLEKVNTLGNEMNTLKNRLRLYEGLDY